VTLVCHWQSLLSRIFIAHGAWQLIVTDKVCYREISSRRRHGPWHDFVTDKVCYQAISCATI